MNFQIDVSSSLSSKPAEPAAPPALGGEVADLLRQMLEVQREQLGYQRAAAAAHDSTARWRAYLSRWSEEFPGLGEGCRSVLPHLERCYGQMMADLSEKLADDGGIDSDFALQEFLDRYGMRLAQLGTILNLVAPLAEAAGAPREEG